ncbi:MAG: hypothetical protein Q9211_003788 [Gyalolechia sp. 1 TL-2023]
MSLTSACSHRAGYNGSPRPQGWKYPEHYFYATQNPGTDGHAAYFGDKSCELVNNLLCSMTVSRNPEIYAYYRPRRSTRLKRSETRDPDLFVGTGKARGCVVMASETIECRVPRQYLGKERWPVATHSKRITTPIDRYF